VSGGQKKVSTLFPNGQKKGKSTPIFGRCAGRPKSVLGSFSDVVMIVESCLDSFHRSIFLKDPLGVKLWRGPDWYLVRAWTYL